MASFEKLFVTSDRHSERVARHAQRLVRLAGPEPGQRVLDVGCGNGATAIQLAQTFGLDATGVDVDPDQIRRGRAAAGTGSRSCAAPAHPFTTRPSSAAKPPRMPRMFARAGGASR